jgi:hypothetical protein
MFLVAAMAVFAHDLCLGVTSLGTVRLLLVNLGLMLTPVVAGILT